MVNIRVDAFPMCCSARVFCDFPNKQDRLFEEGVEGAYNWRTDRYETSKPKERKEYAEELASWFTTQGRPTNIAAFDVITLSHPQVTYLGKEIMSVIEAAGFRKSEPSSGNHAHGVYLFTRVNNPIDADGKISREHRGTIKLPTEVSKKAIGVKAPIKKASTVKRVIKRTRHVFG